MIAEYENLLKDIDHIKKSIESAQSQQSNLDTRMDAIFKKWSEVMLNVIEQINQNFSNFMDLMGFAGEVQLMCPNEVNCCPLSFMLTTLILSRTEGLR